MFAPFDRSKCSNIADNPPHIAGQDKLLGAKYVSFSRTARFVAVSTLTSDGLDTTGIVRTVEGGVELNRPLSDIVNPQDLFGIVLNSFQTSFEYLSRLTSYEYDPATTRLLASTYQSPVLFSELPNGAVSNKGDSNKDWSMQFKQYIYSYGDRSDYSVACVVDGICHVNFRDQVIT